MEAHLNLAENPVAARAVSFLASVADSPLSPVTRELVLLRASQINGRGTYVDTHARGAARDGTSSARLGLVANWREATVFTDAERAALELAEQGTRLAGAAGGITHEAWADAAKHHDENELAALASLIAVINAFNHPAATAARPTGSQRPDRFG
ncbi:carboxymuconolactone decarboxylase family protein [Streptomyces sp. 4N509B]|uniref:carboxymuconolactone decarboxylase family protein n=1 Tax=Streptomyces sp. 4N509B TaxID=3457413 RepID=UPI003FD395B5